MKRDMELVRKILFAMEESNSTIFILPDVPNIDGYTKDKIIYHMRIMANANLLNYEKEEVVHETNINGRAPFKNKFTYEKYYLDWKGHEFVETIRDDTQWNKVKETMTKAGGFIFDIALMVGKSYIEKNVLGLLP